jgi:hypothetical protein
VKVNFAVKCESPTGVTVYRHIAELCTQDMLRLQLSETPASHLRLILHDEDRLKRHTNVFRPVRIVAKRTYDYRGHSASLLVSVWLQLDGFTWNLVLRIFIEICYKTGQKCWVFYMNTSVQSYCRICCWPRTMTVVCTRESRPTFACVRKPLYSR